MFHSVGTAKEKERLPRFVRINGTVSRLASEERRLRILSKEFRQVCRFTKMQGFKCKKCDFIFNVLSHWKPMKIAK